jgi:glycine/D-amino acid oxidase-like deaminating enzyme
VLEREVLSCATAVLALGPWSAEASQWTGVPIDVRPLKGQIIRLRAAGPPIECSVGWGHNYATTKTDGLVWAGTTEEEAGFDEESTLAARDEIGAALLKMLPAMADAQVAQQTACLRPVASDGLLVLGGVPGIDGLYVATGGARKGILYGPAMGHAIADWPTQSRISSLAAPRASRSINLRPGASPSRRRVVSASSATSRKPTRRPSQRRRAAHICRAAHIDM